MDVGSTLRLANMRNGLAFPHDAVCYFQSNHGHRMQTGYFRIDAMPYDAVIHLLRSGKVRIVDATRRRKQITDAQRMGIPTWCLVFNRALSDKAARAAKVCPWETPEMRHLAHHTDTHAALIATVRKLARLYGQPRPRPCIIGENVLLECHQGFIADDQPRRLRELIEALV